MDNSLKILVGVLAISGLVAFLIPSTTATLPPANPAAAQPVAGPVPPPLPTAASESDADNEEVVFPDDGTEEDEFKMGEPSIDGQPFGGSYTPPSNNSGQSQNSGATANDAPAPPLPTNSEGVVIQ